MRLMRRRGTAKRLLCWCGSVCIEASCLVATLVKSKVIGRAITATIRAVSLAIPGCCMVHSRTFFQWYPTCFATFASSAPGPKHDLSVWLNVLKLCLAHLDTLALVLLRCKSLTSGGGLILGAMLLGGETRLAGSSWPQSSSRPELA